MSLTKKLGQMGPFAEVSVLILKTIMFFMNYSR